MANAGVHIVSLGVNLFAVDWPELMHLPGFLKRFITPIIKAARGKQELPFFSLLAYAKWRKDVGEEEAKKWKIKYYKV